MGARIPFREPIGEVSPRQIHEFGDYLWKKLEKESREAQEARTRSGLISGSKLGQPVLWTVLDILGFEKEFDGYTLGKFQRGHDVEARAISFLTDIPAQSIMDILDGKVDNPGWITLPDTALLKGEVHLQAEVHYRGGIGFIDLLQRNNGVVSNHEIKSVTKMAYDKVAATGRSRNGTPEPYYHHSIQLAMYGLGNQAQHNFLHYVNADDYRLTTFAINPPDYKEEIDKEIDDVQLAFISKTLPAFEALLPHHKIKGYQKYGDEWNGLTPPQMLDKLRNQYPEQYELFMSKTLPTGEVNEEAK